MAAAGRAMEELEFVGGIRPRFPAPTRPADVDEAVEASRRARGGLDVDLLQAVDVQDDAGDVPRLCRRLVARVAMLSG